MCSHFASFGCTKKLTANKNSKVHETPMWTSTLQVPRMPMPATLQLLGVQPFVVLGFQTGGKLHSRQESKHMASEANQENPGAQQSCTAAPASPHSCGGQPNGQTPPLAGWLGCSQQVCSGVRLASFPASPHLHSENKRSPTYTRENKLSPFKEDLGWFSVFMLIGVLFLPIMNWLHKLIIKR